MLAALAAAESIATLFILFTSLCVTTTSVVHINMIARLMHHSAHGYTSDSSLNNSHSFIHSFVAIIHNTSPGRTAALSA